MNIRKLINNEKKQRKISSFHDFIQGTFKSKKKF